jgi:acetyltransferase
VGSSNESAARWTSTALTRDGVAICIRPLRPDDRDREREFVDALSEHSRYLRLLTTSKHLSDPMLDQLMDVDCHRRLALAATVDRAGCERFLGVARYAGTEDPGTAELAVVVADAWQRRGIARLLVTELMRCARSEGFERLAGIVLPENHRMLALARSLGFQTAFDSAEHLMRISCDLAGASI